MADNRQRKPEQSTDPFAVVEDDRLNRPLTEPFVVRKKSERRTEQGFGAKKSKRLLDLLEDETEASEPELTVIDAEFLQAARIGDDRLGEILIRQGANINAADPASGMTAIHYYAAGGDALPFIEMMRNHDGVDFLVHDDIGRLPSVLAFECGYEELGAALIEHEIDQAEERGVNYSDLVSVAPNSG